MVRSRVDPPDTTGVSDANRQSELLQMNPTDRSKRDTDITDTADVGPLTLRFEVVADD